MGGGGVLSGGDAHGLGVGGEIQEIGLESPYVRGRMGIYMKRDEKVGGISVGYCGPLLQRQEGVVLPGQDNRGSELLAQMGGESLPRLQYDIFFLHVVSDGARVFAAMTRVNDDRSNAKAQL